MDEYVADIRQRVLERMDLSREMSDEEIENLIGEEASRLMQEEPNFHSGAPDAGSKSI